MDRCPIEPQPADFIQQVVLVGVICVRAAAPLGQQVECPVIAMGCIVNRQDPLHQGSDIPAHPHF